MKLGAMVAVVGVAAAVDASVSASNVALPVCWGRGYEGQTAIPSDLGPVVAIAAGGYHTVALRTDGTVRCWGSNNLGQSAVPAGLSGVVSIVAADSHSVALKGDGTVVCWGRNDFNACTPPPGLDSVASIAAGSFHTVALKRDGSVVCWGNNQYSQCVVPAAIGSIAQIACGYWHTAAIKSDGTVACWGRNESGQCDVPAGLAGVISISGSHTHTAVAKSDGSVACWGGNTSGQLIVPPELGKVVKVATGSFNTIALLADGTIKAWGFNTYLQCIPPAGVEGFLDVSAVGEHTVALRSHLVVPSRANPSILSAIDSASPTVPCTIFVKPGVYTESIALGGKNVVVRGAADHSTVLNGSGLPASIARFTGGEPATAGLANLVFRNGTAGSRITPKGTFTVGGAVYGVNSAARIENCRFEQNEADFGGAVYLLRCDSAVEACVFAGNEALTDGGAFFAYECAGFVRSSDFTANSCGASGSGNGGAFKTVGAKTAGGTFLLQDCSITGTISGVDGAAIHHFENSDLGTRGLLRIVDTEISANSTVVGAAGVRNDGPQTALVLAGTTSVCGNAPRNVGGPFLIEGTASVCGCLADVTGDGQVNGGDLGIVLNSWGGADALGSGDVNHDGVIDASDLSVVLSNWGACGN
jgi:Regulator of chromosome condensation (RCC1) repeat/Dockerin type I domain